MTDLKDTHAMAKAAARPFKGESAAYREARTALLAEEMELRRYKERVAERRRALPAGPVAPDYRFLDADGTEVGLADLFGPHDTLFTYFWMFGPQRERPCPMCTDFIGSFDPAIPNIEQRMAYAVLGRSPVSRQLAFARERGWQHLRFYQTVGDDFAMDQGVLSPDGSEGAAQVVWTLKDGPRRTGRAPLLGGRDERGRPGQDARGVLDPTSLWAVLDLAPAGRGADWYPKLNYAATT
jgi:predicted dithiol-disulfide oxidoreductase (DUF899 family)